MMNASPQPKTDKWGFRDDLLEPLRWAMNPEHLRRPLLQLWPELDPLLRRVELERVYPRGSRGYLLEYRLDLGDGACEPLFAELRGEDAAAYLREVEHKLGKLALPQVDELHPLRLQPDLGLVLRRPGIDHRLEGLGVLHRPDLAEPLLARLLGVEQPPRLLAAQLMAHRLGRRAVVRLRYLVPGEPLPRQAILKCYKSRSDHAVSQYQRLQALRQQGLGDGARLRLVRPLGYDQRSSCLLMEAVDGAPLERMQKARLTDGVRDAGALLRLLQHAKLASLSHHGIDDELAVLQRWVPLTATLFPELAPRLERLLEQVERRLRTLPAAKPQLSHRDFYDKQLMLTPEASVLLDLDTLCVADPALDVGNFLAHLQLLELQRRGRAAPLWRAFMVAVGEQRPLDPDAVTAYRMASLLRIACLHAFWSRWHHLALPLLDAADGL